MGSFFSSLFTTIGRVWFSLVLLLPMIVIAGIIKLCSFCMKKKTLNSTSVLLVSYAWQLSLFLTPWMWVSAKKGYSEKLQMLNKQVIDRSNGVKGARPVFVLGNHTSFLDTILTITRLTTPIVLESKTYMSSHLFKLPILSTICLGCGHFSVPYKGSGDDDFSIDKEKIAATQKLVDQHIEARGVLCFFPEGAMNGNPSEIRAIRYGGMKKALEYDAIIWTFVTNGNQVMWPRKAQIGGIPGYGQYNLKQIAPIGCRELVKQIRNENKNDGDINGKNDFVILSEYVRKKMQEEWDDLLDGSSQGSEEKKEK